MTTNDDYDPGPAPATAGVTLGFRSSYNFQSVVLEVRVDLPSKPDDVEARAHAAAVLAARVLNRHSGMAARLARSIGMDKPAAVVAEQDLLVLPPESPSAAASLVALRRPGTA